MVNRMPPCLEHVTLHTQKLTPLMMNQCRSDDDKHSPSSIRCVSASTNLLYCTGTTPALAWAILANTGSARSKCGCGGLHHPPSLLGSA